jgi:Tetratricopeptide repeat.
MLSGISQRQLRCLQSAPENVPPGTTGSSLLVLCCMMSAIVHAWLGEFDQAERCSEEASILAETNDRPYDMIAADYGRGVVQMMRGDLEEAEAPSIKRFAFRAKARHACFGLSS